MWDHFLDALEGFFTWLWESVVKPIVGWVLHKFVLIFTIIVAVVAWIVDIVDWLVANAANLASKFGDTGGGTTAFGFPSQIIADANVFVPVSEFFVMCAATVALMVTCYSIRFIKWVKEFLVA